MGYSVHFNDHCEVETEGMTGKTRWTKMKQWLLDTLSRAIGVALGLVLWRFILILVDVFSNGGGMYL